MWLVCAQCPQQGREAQKGIHIPADTLFLISQFCRRTWPCIKLLQSVLGTTKKKKKAKLITQELSYREIWRTLKSLVYRDVAKTHFNILTAFIKDSECAILKRISLATGAHMELIPRLKGSELIFLYKSGNKVWLFLFQIHSCLYNMLTQQQNQNHAWLTEDFLALKVKSRLVWHSGKNHGNTEVSRSKSTSRMMKITSLNSRWKSLQASQNHLTGPSSSGPKSCKHRWLKKSSASARSRIRHYTNPAFKSMRLLMDQIWANTNTTQNFTVKASFKNSSLKPNLLSQKVLIQDNSPVPILRL